MLHQRSAIEISNVATMGDGSTKGEIESVTKTPVSDDSVKLTWTLKEGPLSQAMKFMSMVS